MSSDKRNSSTPRKEKKSFTSAEISTVSQFTLMAHVIISQFLSIVLIKILLQNKLVPFLLLFLRSASVICGES